MQGFVVRRILVPINGSPIPGKKPGEYAFMFPLRPGETRFQAILAEHDIPSTIRQRRGIDIAAGCGQLAAEST